MFCIVVFTTGYPKTVSSVFCESTEMNKHTVATQKHHHWSENSDHGKHKTICVFRILVNRNHLKILHVIYQDQLSLQFVNATDFTGKKAKLL